MGVAVLFLYQGNFMVIFFSYQRKDLEIPLEQTSNFIMDANSRYISKTKSPQFVTK